MKVLPTCLFASDDQHADLERRTISGGESLSGDEDLIATDGGGRVFYEIGNPYLDDPETALIWRSYDAYQDGGSVPIIVPFCDARHQPTMGLIGCCPEAGLIDERGYLTRSDAVGIITQPRPLRATVISVSIDWLSRPLVGGEWLSIDHPFMRWRAYRISEIITRSGNVVTLRIRAPLRQALTGGEVVDFANPRCVMRLDGAMPSPMNLGYTSSSGARFVEHFPGPGGYA